MRERVDAFGVSEPELARTGEDQIEVNLPGVEDAERAAQQVGSTAQLFFYDWEKNVLDENCKTNETEINGGQQPVTGLYNAVKRASKCEIAVPKDSQAAAAPRFYAFDKVSKKPFNNGLPDESRAASLEGLDRRREGARGGHRGPARRARPARREAQRQGAGPRRLLDHPRRPRPLGHGHQEPRAELRPAGRQRADRHLRLQRQGPEGVPVDHEPGRPARRRQRQPAQPGPGAELAPLRDRARQRARLDPVHQLPREPRRHRRLDGRADLRRLHDHERPGPREGAQDRRPAAEARPDLALPGLRHARQAGAQPGPQGGHRGLRDRRAVPARLLPRAGRHRDGRARPSTPSTSTRSSS